MTRIPDEALFQSLTTQEMDFLVRGGVRNPQGSPATIISISAIVSKTVYSVAFSAGVSFSAGMMSYVKKCV